VRQGGSNVRQGGSNVRQQCEAGRQQSRTAPLRNRGGEAARKERGNEKNEGWVREGVS
jgi:hypothetical protein